MWEPGRKSQTGRHGLPCQAEADIKRHLWVTLSDGSWQEESILRVTRSPGDAACRSPAREARPSHPTADRSKPEPESL